MIEPRELLGLIPNGLYLIGVRTESAKFIYTGSWLTQASFEPCLIATAVRRTHEGHGMIRPSHIQPIGMPLAQQSPIFPFGISF